MIHLVWAKEYGGISWAGVRDREGAWVYVLFKPFGVGSIRYVIDEASMDWHFITSEHPVGWGSLDGGLVPFG